MTHVTPALQAAVLVASLAILAPVASAQSNVPAVKMEGAIAYVSGGIGQDEVNAIKQVATQYPLELEFARTAGPQNEYVSDVRVLIKDHNGRPVLNTISDGPFLLAKLPDGKYTVSASRRGNTKQQVVQIGAQRHQRLIFMWQQ